MRRSKKVGYFNNKLILVYFMVKGVAGYVLPRFDNTVYIRIEDGDLFGHVDFALDQEMQDIVG